VPQGVVLKDASEVVPRERVFRYASGFKAGSIAGFTKLFRYTVIHEQSGWWTDTDVCCLQPFDFTEDEGFRRADAVSEYEAQHLVRPNDRHMPVPWWEYRRFFFDEQLSIDGCLRVHFWNAMLTAKAIDKDASYAPESVFERLKRRYLDGSFS
jgi:hypothetical protein